MINLKELVGRKIRITDIDEIEYEGVVDEYIDAEDTVPEEIEAIILINLKKIDDSDVFGNPIEFTAPEIKNIDVME